MCKHSRLHQQATKRSRSQPRNLTLKMFIKKRELNQYTYNMNGYKTYKKNNMNTTKRVKYKLDIVLNKLYYHNFFSPKKHGVFVK